MTKKMTLKNFWGLLLVLPDYSSSKWTPFKTDTFAQISFDHAAFSDYGVHDHFGARYLFFFGGEYPT